MTSFLGKIVKFFIRLYTFPYRRKHMSLSANVKFKDKNFKPLKCIDYNKTEYGGVKTEIFKPKQANIDNKAVLFFHGGGNTVVMNNFYRKNAQKIAVKLSCPVYCIDYESGRDRVFPSLFNDCYNAYNAIINNVLNRETRLIAVGDSMGVNLMLSMLFKIREEKRRLPDRIIAISPYVDLTNSGDSYIRNAYKDPMYALPYYQSFQKHGYKLRKKSLYIGTNDASDMYLSPVFGDFTDFPEILIIVGDCEMSQSDSDMLYKAYEKAGQKAVLSTYRGMFHNFLYFAPFLKESKQALKEIQEFANKE